MSLDSEYFKNYYIKNREKYIERAKAHYRNNKEQKKEYDRQRRTRLKESLSETAKVIARKRYFSNPKRMMLDRARNRAKESGLPFSIGIDDINIPDKCPILGIPMEFCLGSGGKENSPSIDRIQNDLGYVPGNIGVISMLANRIKSSLTLEQAEKLVEYLRKVKSP